MGIAAQAPRGGLAEKLAGASRALVLRNAEIERFEDHHGGVFTLWDGFFGRSAKPSARQVRDLVALGLVGGGMSDQKADALVSGLGPEENLRLYSIAQALIGVAFAPDAAGAAGGDEARADAAGDGDGEDPEKKSKPAPGE